MSRIPLIKKFSEKNKDLENKIVKLQKENEDLRIQLREIFQKTKKYDYCVNELIEAKSQIKKHEWRTVNYSQRQKILYNKMGLVDSRLGSVERKVQMIDQQVQLLNNKLENKLELIFRATNENVWGNVFHDSIIDSKWLLEKKFSPGRWAVGYQFLYILYRILDESNPKSILELGLGQSTQMISQYVKTDSEIQHIVVEHDLNWIDFYKNKHEIENNSQILNLQLVKREFLDDPEVLAYADFQKELSRYKFDLILIDAPFGKPYNIYARIDIIDLIPQCLNEDFVILIDDYHRDGEKNMSEILKKKLRENQIEFFEGVYKGNKDTLIITSKDKKFLCTM